MSTDRPRGLDALIPTGPREVGLSDTLKVGLRAVVVAARTVSPKLADELVRDALNEVIYDLDREAAEKPDPLLSCRCGHLLGRHLIVGSCLVCGCESPMPV